MLPRKVLPLALELYLGGLVVHLSSMQVIHHLLKVVHASMGTQVRWHEFGCLIGGKLTINVVAHVRRGMAVDAIGVILWVIP